MDQANVGFRNSKVNISLFLHCIEKAPNIGVTEDASEMLNTFKDYKVKSNIQNRYSYNVQYTVVCSEAVGMITYLI